MHVLLKFFLALFILSVAPSPLHAARCATAAWMNEFNSALQSPHQNQSKNILSGRISKKLAEKPFGRTLLGTHFAINYSLFDLHQVKMNSSDAALRKTADSLRALVSGATIKKDSSTYSRLGLLGKAHPLYVEQVLRYFEAAYSYYVDTLGMRAPQGSSFSQAYQVLTNPGSRFVIDLADLGTWDARYRGEFYAITLSPPELSVVFENDFLYKTRLNSSGLIEGDSIESRVNGIVNRNYVLESELGIKVSAYHEYYHAIQFTYVPSAPEGYHAWYELSAVGMEERKVPEVDDYFQYLPCLLNSPTRIGVLMTGKGCDAEYANSPFHLFLTKKTGENFDTGIWQRLGDNGNRIELALTGALNALGHPLSEVFPAYAAELVLSGRATSYPVFAADQPRWPKLKESILALSGNGSEELRITLPPLTFWPLKITKPLPAGRYIAKTPQAGSIFRLNFIGDSAVFFQLPKSETYLSATNKEASEDWIIIANADPASASAVSITGTDIPLRFFPNPLSLGKHSELKITQSTKTEYPLKIEIVSEAGLRTRTLVFSNLELVTDWDLKNENGKPVSPGIYQVRVNGKKLSGLLIRP